MNVTIYPAEHYREEALGAGRKDYHLWLVPRVSLLCEQRLEEHGVHGSFTSIRELPLLLYRLDSDLASMELPMCYRVSPVKKD